MISHLLKIAKLSSIIIVSFLMLACTKDELSSHVKVKTVKETDEVSVIKAAADKGDPEAQWLYSVELRSGTRSTINKKEAFEYRERAANSGHVIAKVALADMLWVGDGTQVDIDRAEKLLDESFPKLEQMVLDNDPQATYYLSVVLATGTKSIPVDRVRSNSLVVKSAENNYLLAKEELQRINGSNLIKQKEYDKVIEGWRALYETGSYNAAYFIAMIYGYYKIDSKLENEWLIKGWEKGCVKCGHVLAQNYAHNKDSEEALFWATKAAEKGLPEAQFQLGEEYLYEINIKQKNEQKAIELFNAAANQFYVPAMIKMADLYSKGESVPKDNAKAFALYKAAAISGDPRSISNISYAYGEGVGVDVDNFMAYAWANLAVPTKLNKELTLKNRSIFESRLSKSEIIEAQELTSGWRPGRDLIRKSYKTKDIQKLEGGVGSTNSMTKANVGTGFFVTDQTHILTVAHVADEICKEVKISGKSGKVSIVAVDKANDLALLRLDEKSSEVSTLLSDANVLRQGEDAVVFGFPLNTVLSSGGNLTPGVISALTGFANNSNQIQITAPIQPGSSGSPVIDLKGRVVGMVTMKLSENKMINLTGQTSQNVNFAIGIQTLRAFLDANKVKYKTNGFINFSKSKEDIADKARSWTTIVECWR